MLWLRGLEGLAKQPKVPARSEVPQQNLRGKETKRLSAKATARSASLLAPEPPSFLAP